MRKYLPFYTHLGIAFLIATAIKEFISRDYALIFFVAYPMVLSLFIKKR